MSYANIKLDLLRLKLETIAGAYVKHTGKPQVGKSEMIDELARMIDHGFIRVDDVKGAPLASPVVATPQVVDLSPITQSINALQSVVTRTEDRLERGFDGIDVGMKQFDQELTSIKNRVKSIELERKDSSNIDRQVGELIAQAFEPFKQAVIDQGAQAVVADMSAVRVVDRKTCLEVFGVDLPYAFDIYNHPDAPALDPNFIWNEDILRSLAFGSNEGSNLWFGGAKGTGKSETARQFASRTGRAFTRINFHKYSTASEYIGDVGLENGATVFKQGDFLKAYTCPSSIILLDEVTNCSEGELAPLNAFLEPKPQVNYGGITWRKAQGVMVIGADNTLLSGDSSGLYGGTKAMNVAFGERFDLVIEFKHMPKDVEINAVIKHTGCTPELAEHVIDAFNVCRAKVDTGDVIDSPSIRQVMAFIRALPYMSTEQAWERTVCARQPLESALALKQIGKATLNESKVRG